MQAIAVMATELPRDHAWERRQLPQLQMGGEVYDAIFLAGTETRHVSSQSHLKIHVYSVARII